MTKKRAFPLAQVYRLLESGPVVSGSVFSSL